MSSLRFVVLTLCFLTACEGTVIGGGDPGTGGGAGGGGEADGGGAGGGVGGGGGGGGVQEDGGTNTDGGIPPNNEPWPTAGGATAVTTFQSIGLYWKPTGGSTSRSCSVQYRKQGAYAWNDGLPLWFDARNSEYRGSLVQLDSGTAYQIKLSLSGAPETIATLTATTWSETFPISQTITLPASSSATLTITQSGSASGYILYTAASGGSTIDPANAQDFCVRITGAYVIVRGISCVNARRDGIRLETGAHDVVIEDNEISGWGRLDTRGNNWGINGDSAIHVAYKALGIDRIVIQRNFIHDPRYDSNTWATAHPAGPVGIYFENCSAPDDFSCGSNHVIRWNDVLGNATHHFMDGIGGEDNFTATGFPNADTDIYGNRVRYAWDDGIESEGGNKNVRIWGNYLDETFTGVASATTHTGPLYIFRNVYDISRWSTGDTDTEEHGPFGKLGDNAGFGGGRRYYFHNTLLQQPPPSGKQYPLGAGNGPLGGSGERPMVQLVSRNNIWHVWKSSWDSVYGNGSSSNNDLDYDLHNGAITVGGTGNNLGTHGITGTPTYASGNGAVSRDQGKYALATGTSGYDGAERLPNFNDRYLGNGPDIGAAEAGAPAMKFGRAVLTP